jgi:hypothetical protein
MDAGPGDKMNATNTETSRQFNALAPAAVKVAGKTYKRKGGVYDDAANCVRFDFVGRKQRGAFIADKVVVAVTYQHGADLYDVVITKCDGATFENADLANIDGVEFSAFRDFPTWIN